MDRNLVTFPVSLGISIAWVSFIHDDILEMVQVLRSIKPYTRANILHHNTFMQIFEVNWCVMIIYEF